MKKAIGITLGIVIALAIVGAVYAGIAWVIARVKTWMEERKDAEI